MQDHAYATFDRVWFHHCPTNVRLQWATVKLGTVRVGTADPDLRGSVAGWMRFR